MSVFVIACGGTGGHLSPGIAVAEALERYGHKCHLIVSNKAIDQVYIQKYPQLKFVQSPGIAFSLKPLGFLRYCWELLHSLTFCIRYLQEIKPDLVLGFGGFNSVAPILSAFILGCPTALHESNRVPGKAVRVLSRLVHRVYLPEGIYLKGVSSNTIKHFGYPLRDSIQIVSKEAARLQLGLPVKGKVLAIIGGSQGAVSFNDWVRNYMDSFLEEEISVFAITGKVNGGVAQRAILAQKGTSKIIGIPFTDCMGDVLCSADLVLSRAGAGTIAELISCHTPSLLMPYPYAADNHQQANALFLEKQGACVVVPQEKLENLYDEVVSLIYNDWLLSELKRNLSRLSRVNSLALMVDDLEKMASHTIKFEENKSKTSL